MAHNCQCSTPRGAETCPTLVLSPVSSLSLFVHSDFNRLRQQESGLSRWHDPLPREKSNWSKHLWNCTSLQTCTRAWQFLLSLISHDCQFTSSVLGSMPGAANSSLSPVTFYTLFSHSLVYIHCVNDGFIMVFSRKHIMWFVFTHHCPVLQDPSPLMGLSFLPQYLLSYFHVM